MFEPIHDWNILIVVYTLFKYLTTIGIKIRFQLSLYIK